MRCRKLLGEEHEAGIVRCSWENEGHGRRAAGGWGGRGRGRLKGERLGADEEVLCVPSGEQAEAGGRRGST